MIFAVLCGAGSGLVGFALGGVVFNTTWRLMFPATARLVKQVSLLVYFIILFSMVPMAEALCCKKEIV